MAKLARVQRDEWMWDGRGPALRWSSARQVVAPELELLVTAKPHGLEAECVEVSICSCGWEWSWFLARLGTKTSCRQDFV